MPQGKLWDFEEMPKLVALFRGLAAEGCRVEDLIDKLLYVESDPRLTDEYLADWERAWGLPDECTPDGLSVADRRTQLVQKIIDEGGLSKTYFEGLGLDLGFTIDVTKWQPFLAGHSVAGDPLTNDFDDRFRAGDRAGERIYIWGWKYYFNVELPASAATVFHAGDRCGGRLSEFSNPLIECTIKKRKPAYGGVTFTFV